MTLAPGKSTRVLYVCAALLLALEVAALDVQRDWQRANFIALALLQGVVYACAAVCIWRDRAGDTSLWFVLLVAAALRVGPLLGPVIWTSDINRYVWDGWVQQAGFNPYCCVPTDPQLAHLRDDAIYPEINRRDFAPTIYPPVAQMAFLAGAWLGGTILSVKALMVAFEAIGVLAMIGVLRRTGRSPALVLLYAWHPLAIWEIAGSGHVDALFVAFVPLALLAAITGRRALAGVALGAAVLAKFIPVVLFPALWTRRDFRMPLAFVATLVAGYLPYSGVGWRVFGYLPGYVDEEKLSAGAGQGFWLLDTLRTATGAEIPGIVYLVAAAAIVAGLGVAAALRAPAPAETARATMVLGVTTLLLLSPHYAWYFVLPIALATMSPYPPALWPGLAAFLLYWEPEGGRVPTWVGGVIYGGFAAAAILWHLRRRTPRTTGATHVPERAL